VGFHTGGEEGGDQLSFLRKGKKRKQQEGPRERKGKRGCVTFFSEKKERKGKEGRSCNHSCEEETLSSKKKKKSPGKLLSYSLRGGKEKRGVLVSRGMARDPKKKKRDILLPQTRGGKQGTVQAREW